MKASAGLLAVGLAAPRVLAWGGKCDITTGSLAVFTLIFRPRLTDRTQLQDSATSPRHTSLATLYPTPPKLTSRSSCAAMSPTT